MVSLCHCRDCRRRTGAVAGSGAIFEKTEVTIEGVRKVFVRDAAEAQSCSKMLSGTRPDCVAPP
nr:GFA family protein [Rhizobium croatiense]